MRGMVLLLSLVLALALPFATGSAQMMPENHYLVYDVPETYTFTGQIALFDQFRFFCTTEVFLDKMANPVEKNGEMIWDPMLHQTWWTLHDPQSVWWTTIENQFGDQVWKVKDGRFLVLPALKNDPGTVPPWNHYKCYDAVGPALNMTVTLVDQFGTYEMMAMEPVLFCNPVEKCVNGITYPIIEPMTHLACYRLEPPTPASVQPVMMYDQFGDWQVTPLEPCWLCVPSMKLHTVPTHESTWGKIKELYSD
jgi:hypothetical protein